MRLFEEHIKRNTCLLDGIWELVTDEKDVGRVPTRWLQV